LRSVTLTNAATRIGNAPNAMSSDIAGAVNKYGTIFDLKFLRVGVARTSPPEAPTLPGLDRRVLSAMK
jgi:hypothetical protein